MNTIPTVLCAAGMLLVTTAPGPHASANGNDGESDSTRRTLVEASHYELDHTKPHNADGTPLSTHAPVTVVIDELVNHYGSVVFDHALHVGMSRCVNCHHENDADEAVAACGSCHRLADFGSTDISPSLKGAYHRQCLGCHRDWSHANACGFCHAEAGAVTPTPGAFCPADLASASIRHMRVQPTFTYQTDHPGVPVVTFQHADHTERFGVSCADCHGEQSCAQCHGPRSEPSMVKREESCLACHEGQSCVYCHNVAPERRFNHAVSTGWTLETYHAALSCAECHGDGMIADAPLTDRCRACHGDSPGTPFVHADRGVPLLGSHVEHECTDCHENGTREAASCDDCHEARSYPMFSPGKPLTVDRTNRLNKLEKQNARFKKLVADLSDQDTG